LKRARDDDQMYENSLSTFLDIKGSLSGSVVESTI